jgi:uncharacterized iron-regulated protein
MLLILLAHGCAAILQKAPTALKLQGLPVTLQPGDIVATQTGSVLSFDALMAQLSDQQIIYVGETHVSAADHQIQLRILEALHAANKEVSLGMEMFPRAAQPILDTWSEGSLSEQQFLKDVKWEAVWGYPFFLYQPLLLFSRDHHLPVVGLNAPSEVVRDVARNGLSQLNPEDRAQLAEHFDFSNSEHRKAIRETYDQHAPGGMASFENFYEAQLAWEETMAETLAAHLASRPPGAQVLVTIGNGHVEYQFGVPQRALARYPHRFRTIVTIPANTEERSIDPAVADYVWITPPLQPFHAPHRGRIGIRLKTLESGGGVRIAAVLPGSPGAQAGLRDGDVLVEVNDTAVADLEDVHNALAFAPQGGLHHLRILRDGCEQSVTVEISKE